MERRKNALLGAVIADAASMGLHWIYDSSKVDTLTAGGKSPEFFEPPSCPFYTYDAGRSSPYGDEVVPLIKSLADRGALDIRAFEDEAAAFFESYDGRLNGVMKEFLSKYRSGKRFPETAIDDDQAHGLVKVPPIVAKYAGDPSLLAKVKEAVSMHQSNSTIIELSQASAVLLEKIVLGASIPEALEWAEKDEGGWIKSFPAAHKLLVAAMAFQGSAREACKAFGASCHLPGCFQVPLVVLKSNSDYRSAVRDNILASGDNCSRAALVGACFGAVEDGGIPSDWTAKAARYDEIAALAAKIVE